MPAAAVEAELCAALRREVVHPQDPLAFAEAAVAEGVAPLLVEYGASSTFPAEALTLLREEVHRQLALAAVRTPELSRVLAALSAAGADVLVIKGAHLAHAFYAAPALRPRQDTDLLVRPAHRASATRALVSLGYAPQPAITGDAVQGQTIFDRPEAPGAALDVHWRLASPVVAADLFDFDALWADSRPVPALGGAARGPYVLDAIAIAAVHQLAHHPSALGLAWLFDLHVLLRTLDDDAVARFAERARSRRMSALCAAAIRRAQERFPTEAGSRLLEQLVPEDAEPSAALLATRRPMEQALMDVRALKGWRAQVRYAAGHLFPPADYMRHTYAPGSRAPLSWLYVRRIMKGARKWIRAPAAAGRS